MFVRTTMENFSYQCISTRFAKATSKVLSEAESKLPMFILDRILSELRADCSYGTFKSVLVTVGKESTGYHSWWSFAVRRCDVDSFRRRRIYFW